MKRKEKAEGDTLHLFFSGKAAKKRKGTGERFPLSRVETRNEGEKKGDDNFYTNHRKWRGKRREEYITVTNRKIVREKKGVLPLF